VTGPAHAPSVVDPETRLQHALELAYRHLSRRDRTVLEVRRHLEARRIEPGTIAEALADLERQGALDDVRYARLFAEDRRRLDGWGPERIERRLLHAGIAPDVVAEVVRSAPETTLEQALEVLRGRVATPPRDDRERERALGLLVRRGYDLDTAYAAVRTYAPG
jgi:regulatory protein